MALPCLFVLQGNESGSTIALELAPLAVQLHAAMDAAQSADAAAQQAADATLQHQSAAQRTHVDNTQVLHAQASKLQSQLQEAQVGQRGDSGVRAFLFSQCPPLNEHPDLR